MEEKYLLNKAVSANALLKSKEIANSTYINVVSNTYIKKIDAYEIKAEILDGLITYNVALCLSTNKGIILNSSCDCPSHDNSKKACKHILALAQYAYNVLKYNQTFPDYSPSKNKNIKQNNYNENIQLAEYINKLSIGENYFANSEFLSEKVKIIPEISEENETFFVRFYISSKKSRQYVLYDFEEFVSNMENESYYSYGKTLSFVHTENVLDEPSLSLYFWIRDNYKDFVFSNKEIIISPKLFDSFFKALNSLKVKIKFDDELLRLNSEYNIINKDLPIELSINRIDEDYYSLNVDNVIHLFKGERKLLLLSGDNTLYILGKAYSSKIVPLLDSIIGEENVLKTDNLFKLINIVVPIFNGKIILKNKESFNPEFENVKAEFYFDRLDDNGISLYVNFVYKNIQYPYITSEEKDLSQSRDFVTELEIEKTLGKYFDIFSSGQRILIQNDELKQFDLLKDGLPELSKYGEIYVSDNFKNIKLRTNNNIRLGVGIGIDGLFINVLESDIAEEEIKEVYKSFFEGKKYHRLKDGSFISLTENAIYEYFDILNKLGVNEKDFDSSSIKLSKYKSIYIDELLKNTHYVGFKLDNDFKNMLMELNNIPYADIEIPKEVKDKIRSYQVFGFSWLKTLYKFGMGGILADDMGLGKTLQVISLLLSNKKENKKSINLVVCPASLVYNWREEINKFTSELSVKLISGNADLRKNQINSLNKEDVIITSYDSLKRDIELYKNFKFDVLVADEAQYIKNHETLNSKLLRSIRANSRFALTGTPIENNLSELWSIFDFILPGYLLKYNTFSKKFEAPIILRNDTDAKETLKKIISPFILRRLKKDVLVDLPEKIESTIYSEMGEEQENLYNIVLKSVKNKLSQEEENGAQVVQVLAMLTRLRQIVCDPKLLNIEKYYNISSSKKELCLELIRSNIEAGHRIIVFSNFASMIDVLSNELNKEGIDNLLLVGSTPSEKRHLMVKRFNESNIPVFLISLKAGGVGLNLTGADTVIHYDPWWNLSAKNQATDRAYRIGQEKNVQVYNLITKNTLEENILDLQMKKGELADSMINGSADIIKKLTMKDILSMLA